MSIKNKNIILIITGSIASYKSIYLLRSLVNVGANVKVVLTPNAGEFVPKTTLSVLSGNKVLDSSIEEDNQTFVWNDHTKLVRWADILIIAPCTANFISNIANGICNNLAYLICLSALDNVDKYIVPAMEQNMYYNDIIQKNISKLISLEYNLIEPDKGFLASGSHGYGRMVEPDEIVRIVSKKISDDRDSKKPFSGKKIMITAGPTYESIDNVRFISNLSSAKMGFALAKKSLEYGADVILITGPTNLTIDDNNLKRIDVVSSDDMLKECKKYYEQVDVFISNAAVSDYKPKDKFDYKIKSSNKIINLTLEKNHDMLKILSHKSKNKFIVGFALEDKNELDNAKKKLKDKNLDMICLNSLNDNNAGISQDSSRITIIDKDGNIKDLGFKLKMDLAGDILDHIYKKYIIK